jgi:D-tyrosyl-tRNA(Tyr) deacylase
MIGLLQRVSEARVSIDEQPVAEIGAGLLVLVGVVRGDGEAQAERLVDRLLAYRVFPDREGQMNLSLSDTGGGLLLVPQFTLPANTRKGNRASFTPAAPPEAGERLFRHALEYARGRHGRVEAGVFGAEMRVALVNEGPVTFWLEAKSAATSAIL